jgi:hypothetical protein
VANIVKGDFCDCSPFECHGLGIYQCRWKIMEQAGWTPPPMCDHEWIDIRNSIIRSGSACRKCGLLRAEDVSN